MFQRFGGYYSGSAGCRHQAVTVASERSSQPPGGKAVRPEPTRPTGNESRKAVPLTGRPNRYPRRGAVCWRSRQGRADLRSRAPLDAANGQGQPSHALVVSGTAVWRERLQLSVFVRYLAADGCTSRLCVPGGRFVSSDHNGRWMKRAELAAERRAQVKSFGQRYHTSTHT
jgi:hypothetical protein